MNHRGDLAPPLGIIGAAGGIAPSVFIAPSASRGRTDLHQKRLLARIWRGRRIVIVDGAPHRADRSQADDTGNDLAVSELDLAMIAVGDRVDKISKLVAGEPDPWDSIVVIR